MNNLEWRKEKKKRKPYLRLVLSGVIALDSIVLPFGRGKRNDLRCEERLV